MYTRYAISGRTAAVLEHRVVTSCLNGLTLPILNVAFIYIDMRFRLDTSNNNDMKTEVIIHGNVSACYLRIII